jgi:NADH-quinone oxidoreductase subunit I/electron transport complex protein RnfC
MSTEVQRGKVYVIERPAPKVHAGQGLLAGLGVVIKHFTGAFGKKLDNPSKLTGVHTIQYPEERRELPQAFRNFPILLYDDETGHELCTSCFQCQRICPPQVIHMTQAKDPATNKAVPAVAEFMIEYDACMSCGLCAEVCPFDAIKMDHDFELSTGVHGGLTVDRQGLMRPVSYYEKLAPSFWAEVKEGAYKKLQGNMKRRSGLIGIAPQMAEKVKQLRAAAPPPAAPAAPPASAAPAAPAAATPAAPPDDKAARLAAIRARNAAQTTDGSAPGTAAAPAPDAGPAATQDDKAARLAAIRARNAAKAATGGDAPAPPVEPAAAPPDDKAARLAAIRAANAAKAAASGEPPPATPAPAVAAGSEPAAAPAPAAPPDDKAARLAAIRAANAARKGAPSQPPPGAPPDGGQEPSDT